MYFNQLFKKDFNKFSTLYRQYVSEKKFGRNILNVTYSKSWITGLKPRTCSDDSTKIILKKPISDKILRRFRRRDRIPIDFDLIYRCPKSFGFICAQTGVIAVFFSGPIFIFLVGSKNDFKLPITINSDIFIGSVIELWIFGIITAAVLLSTLTLVGRFPLRIYHNKKTNDYIAATSNMLFPWRSSHIYFKKGQVKPIRESEMWPLQISNFKINGNKIIFVEEYFDRPMDLEYMTSEN